VSRAPRGDGPPAAGAAALAPRSPAPRLRALLAAQFLGAFNDNALRIGLGLLGIASATAGAGSPPEREAAAQARMTLVFVVFTLPLCLMSIPAGVLADRVSKRRVLIAMKVGELALMLGVALALRVDPWGGWLPLCMLAGLGVRAALFSPAKYGLLPEILPPRQLPEANGLLEMWTFAAILAGTYAGGLLVWLAGPSPWRFGAALAALSALGLVAALGVPRVRAARAHGGVAAAWASAWSSLRADRLLALGIGGTVWFWALASLVSQDLLVYAKLVLGLSDAAAALPLAALAVGLAAGSVLAGRLAGADDATPLEYGLLPLGAGAITALMLLLGLLAPPLSGTLALMAALGVASGGVAIPLNVLIQWRAPADRRGAVVALSNTFAFAGVIGGSLAAGVLAQLGVSPMRLLVVAAAAGALGTAAAAALLPGASSALLRRLASRGHAPARRGRR
jgi:acyl-[acyl-carrier-protein]-phospholipid O-acyltransferase/long-chain-fatty-acid--[acyl-carrier-protein] ligase